MARPTKYDSKMHPQFAQALASLGLTEKEISVKMNIAMSTLSKWKGEYPEFSEALKQGKIEPDEKVERSLYERAVGYYHDSVKIFMPGGAKNPVYAPYIEHVAPDTTACIFWLKNRKPKEWRDRQELTGSEGGPIGFRLVKPGEADISGS